MICVIYQKVLKKKGMKKRVNKWLDICHAMC